ncbi:MAG: N-acetylmuramoyl-L-alanine amidase [Verrucomicrobiota bacterium]
MKRFAASLPVEINAKRIDSSVGCSCRVGMKCGGFLGVLLLLLGALDARSEIPIIVIDPGHGGTSVAGSLSTRSNSSPNNAISPGGLKEKDINLEFSMILREVLEQEARRTGPAATIILTREEDRNLSFIERAAICNHPATAAIVSIHFNAGGGGRALGSLALIGDAKRNGNYETDHAFGEVLAEACTKGVKTFIPQSKSRGVITDGHLHGGLGSNFFYQLNQYRHLRAVPKCFLEVEFMDNPIVEETLLLRDRADKFRVISKEIAAALLNWVDSRARNRSVP